MFAPFRRHRDRREIIERLYGAIVAQAREPVFYSELGVPDTLEGRFDLLVLHVYLLFRRLAEQDKEARAVGQGVFDRFVQDMDDSLREMGTGDLAVPKRMRAIGEAFYGRAEAYDAALRSDDDELLMMVLSRNVYGNSEHARSAALHLARYVRKAQHALAIEATEALVRGQLPFPAPEIET